MHKDLLRASVLVALVAALALAIPALADSGSGGTPIDQAPPVAPSGGVPGPEADKKKQQQARPSQAPGSEQAQEEPPTIEQPTTPEDYDTPAEEAPDDEAGEAPDDDAGEAPAGAGGAPSGGGGGGWPRPASRSARWWPSGRACF